MTEAGLEDEIRFFKGGLTEADGVHAASLILGTEHLPTGLIAFNDRCAIGVIDALTREGIDVPGTLSMVGFDDSTVAGLPQINLTTVAQDTRALASLSPASMQPSAWFRSGRPWSASWGWCRHS